MEGKDKKIEGLVRDIHHAPAQIRPKEPATSSEYAPRQKQNILDIILEHQSAAKSELVLEISSIKNSLEEKIDTVISILTKDNRSIEKKSYELLKFIQNLNVYLEDSRINPDFAKFVQEEIKGVLSTYGYRLVEYEYPFEDCYEVEIEDLHDVEIQVVRRAIVDKENNLIIQGKIWKKRD